MEKNNTADSNTNKTRYPTVNKEEWDKFVEEFLEDEMKSGNEAIEDFVKFMSDEPGKSEAKKIEKNYTTILAALLSTAVNTKKDVHNSYKRTYSEVVVMHELWKIERKAYKVEREEYVKSLQKMQESIQQQGEMMKELQREIHIIRADMESLINGKIPRLDNKSIGLRRMLEEIKTMQFDSCKMLSTVLKSWKRDNVNEKENVDPTQPKITAVLGKRNRDN